jgi:hypothetical protein
VRRAVLVAAALALATAVRLPAAWESGNALNHVSGVWLALADDLARGTFYRPLHAATGATGGTRYFPLAFALHAALVRAGLPLVAAGQALSLAAGLLVVAGVAALVRAAGASRTGAAAAGVVALAGFAGQYALGAARGDLLPVGLSALGLALLERGGPAPTSRSSPALARRRPVRTGAVALLLVLAFAAKPTALSATAAAVLAVAARRGPRAALALGGVVAAGCAAVVAATDVLSGGRFLSALGAVAAAGADPRSLVAAPLRLAGEAAREDPAGLALLALAGLSLAGALPALLRDPESANDPRLVPALWLASAGATALAVYATPGTGVNHLVEVEAAAAALLGACAAGAGRRAAAAQVALTAAATLGLCVAASLWRADRASSHLAEARAVVRALPRGGPVVSEDPLVPLLAGTSPLLLDPFALRVEAAAAPALSARLAAGLRRGAFPAVVLLADLDAPGADAWYARGNLGPPLVAEIRRGYRHARTFGRYHLYLPRGPPPRGGGAPGASDGGVVRREAAR